MKHFYHAFLALCVAATPLAASADPWKDESGHGRGKHGHRKHKGEYKEEYWDGHCKVKRKLDKNGEYEEERKCKGASHHHDHVEVIAPSPAIIIDPAIRVHGTVTIRP